MHKGFSVILILIAGVVSTMAQTDELKRINAEVVKLFREAKYAEALKASENASGLTAKAHGDDSVEFALVLSNQAYILTV